MNLGTRRAVTPLVPGHTVRIKGAKGDLAIHNGKVGVIRGAASQSQVTDYFFT